MFRRLAYFLSITAFWVWLMAGAVAQTNQLIPFSGTAPGQPDGATDLTFKLYDAATGGSYLGYTDAQSSVDVSGEAFSIVLGLGSGGPVPPALFANNSSVYIAIELTSAPGTEIADRVPLYASGFALFAQRANTAQTAQSATNAQTAQNATNAQAAQNAVNAQTAQTAMMAQTFNPGASVSGNLPGAALALSNTNLSSGIGITAQSASSAGTAGLFINSAGDLLQGKVNPASSPVFRLFNNGGAYFSGNVGIGTATPTRAKLETSGMVGNTLALFGQGQQGISLVGNIPSIGFNAYYNAGWKSISPGGTGVIDLNTENGGMVFYTAQNTTVADSPVTPMARVRITSTGNVGIGTQFPDARLHVAGGFRHGGVGEINIDYGPNPIFPSIVGGRLKILENGNVGIGTANPPVLPLQVSNRGPYNKPASGVLLGNSWAYLLADNVFHNSLIWDANRDMRFGTETSVGNGYSEKVRITKDGNVGIGTTNPQAKLHVEGRTITNVLQINGGSDLSEQFEVNAAPGLGRGLSQQQVEPGLVVTIDPDNPGKLVVSNRAYDRRVAGILSGAGGVATGMLMGQSGTLADGRHPVALTGRVYVWADASSGSIVPGDLLTTSNLPGHAMRVTNYNKAQGAIIGKAMTGLKDGKGLVLVLVTLQ